MNKIHAWSPNRAFQTLSTLYIKMNYFWRGCLQSLTPYTILSDIWNSLSGIQCVWVHISQLVLLKCIEILYSILSFEKCSVPYNNILNILSIISVCLVAESFLDEHTLQYVLEYILQLMSYITLQYFTLSLGEYSVPYSNSLLNILSINYALVAKSFLDEPTSQYVVEYILHLMSYITLQYFALYLTVIPCWTYN